MFGIGFIRVQPTTYLLQYRDGKVVREGAGMAFFYYAPTTSLVAVPIASTDGILNDFIAFNSGTHATTPPADKKGHLVI